MKIYTADNCKECEMLKKYIPLNAMVINTSTDDGLAEALYGGVYSVPTIIIDRHTFQGFYECRKLLMGE